MKTLFTDNEPFVCEWLKRLFPTADVCRSDIQNLKGEDTLGYARCHFFAGIGGWNYALDLAGWPEQRTVWTASCPCQPFSGAGKRKGEEDKRHLWPELLRLIAERRPPTVFGEQVSGPPGRKWLAGVRADLEDLGYAVGAADLCAASVGAPHVRQRLYWVAHTEHAAKLAGMDDTLSDGRRARGKNYTEHERHLADAAKPGGGVGYARKRQSGGDRKVPFQSTGKRPWDDFDALPCFDGKARRVEPGSFPLAHGTPGRVGRLRAYGNAIVPQVAAVFIQAFMEAENIRWSMKENT